MARIYISYQNDDRPFAIELAQKLKAAGHLLSYDVEVLPAGTAWRTTLDHGLRNSEIFIVIVSKNTLRSQSVFPEVGAARAYSLESGRMLIVPIIIDEMDIPLPLQDIQAIVRPDRNFEEILRQVELAISSFIGTRAAQVEAAAETAQKIQSNAAGYIGDAIKSLGTIESRDRWLGYLWYTLGFISLVIGIGFALWNLSVVGQQELMKTESLVLVALKALVVIGLLGACAKYAFSLGKSYASEALKCSDRMHAIRFGEFYLNAFGDKTKWEELKEVFQHWNIDRASTFSSLDSSSIDPKLAESMLELTKFLHSSKSAK